MSATYLSLLTALLLRTVTGNKTKEAVQKSTIKREGEREEPEEAEAEEPIPGTADH